jgi:hypothetical protein
VKVAVMCIALALFADAGTSKARFHGEVSPVPDEVAARMRGHSWHEGCPIPIAELAYLRVSFVGYDGAVHEGELVVQAQVAREVLDIFRDLFELRYPIEKMQLVDGYGGDDDASMADNNTSGFNCRFVAGKPGVFSKHSYGRAIDVNPRVNPMVVKGQASPQNGATFVDRRRHAPGLLRMGDKAVTAFIRRGWAWGGAWVSLKDYQHFEKSTAR